MQSPEALLSTLLSIADAGGQTILAAYGRHVGIEYKGPDNPVTQADRDANRVVCELLRQHFPDAAIVAEESAPDAFHGFQTAERVFFVDPLDGTKEFISKSGEFAVMIGLVVGDSVNAGVILAPTRRVAWGGVVGAGAWRFEGGTRKPLVPSSRQSLLGGRAVVSRSTQAPSLVDAFQSMKLVTDTLGSAGLRGAAVAEGLAEVYCAPGKVGSRWDSCAPDAIVTAAGGVFTDAAGALYNYRTDELVNRRGVAVSTLALHSEVVDLLRDCEDVASG